MTLTYRWALVPVITLCTGIWLGQKYASGNSASNPIERMQQDSYPKSAEQISSEQLQLQQQLQQQIKQLHAENLQLKKQLQALAHPSPEQHATSSARTDNDLLSRLQTLEMEKQQRKATDIINWVMQVHEVDSNFDLNNELLNRFEQENKDPAWAEQQESYYRQLFNEQSELQGIALRDTRCRSTQCEITIGISTIEQSNQLLQTISNSLTVDGQAVAIMIAADESRGISRLYISNNENSFEPN